MPRIRSLKPEFWGHPKTAKVSRDARLLFLGLLSESDDDGRQLGSPKRISSAVYPNDDDVTPKQIVGWLDELEVARMVTRYAVDGVAYLLIDGFGEHQKISHKTPSRLPSPAQTNDSGKPPENLPNNSGATPETFAPDLGSRIKDLGTASLDAEFAAWWSEYPRKVDKVKAREQFRRRRREGVALETLTFARDAYRAQVNGSDSRYILHPPTFLAKDGRWADDWANARPAPDDWMVGR